LKTAPAAKDVLVVIVVGRACVLVEILATLVATPADVLVTSGCDAKGLVMLVVSVVVDVNEPRASAVVTVLTGMVVEVSNDVPIMPPEVVMLEV
jgi:hypothetical protein